MVEYLLAIEQYRLHGLALEHLHVVLRKVIKTKLVGN